MRPAIAMAIALFLSLATAAGAAAAPGQVEIAYGGKGGGSVDITPALPADGARWEPIGLALGPRNESLVLASSIRLCAPTLVCASYTALRVGSRGTLDPGFGARVGSIAGGSWSPSAAPRLPSGAVAVQPDGKAVLALELPGAVMLLRLNQDGTPDQAFGSAGRVVTALIGRPTVTSVAVRKDGAIVVAGGLETSTGGDLFLARYTPAGQPDSSFGTGGMVVADLGTAGDSPAGIALSGEETLVGAPICCAENPLRLSVARFSQSGVMSRLFDGRPPPALFGAEPTGISALIPGRGGALKVVGGGREEAFVASYRPNGTPDRDFGKRGVAHIPNLTLDGGAAAVRDRHGGVVLVGARGVSSGFEQSRTLTIRRVKPSGRVDGLFGGARPNLVVEPQPGIQVGLDLTRGIAAAQQPNGRIVVLAAVEAESYECFRTCPPPHYGLIRYFGAKAKRPPRCQGRVATIAGTPKDDTLTGTRRRDVIAAFAGDDTVRGNGGNDLVCGGPGADTLSGGPGDDRLRGGPGRDSVRQ
jgi:uncharacterized delta-60 repeat protein